MKAVAAAVLEYGLWAIGAVLGPWRRAGDHRLGWGQPSRFDTLAAEWGRPALAAAEVRPRPLALVEPDQPTQPITIGQRRHLRLVDGVELVTIGHAAASRDKAVA